MAIYISEWRYIFQSGDIYFRVEIYISDRPEIIRSSKIYFGVGTHIPGRLDIFLSGIHYSKREERFRSVMFFFRRPSYELQNHTF